MELSDMYNNVITEKKNIAKNSTSYLINVMPIRTQHLMIYCHRTCSFMAHGYSVVCIV